MYYFCKAKLKEMNNNNNGRFLKVLTTSRYREKVQKTCPEFVVQNICQE